MHAGNEEDERAGEHADQARKDIVLPTDAQGGQQVIHDGERENRRQAQKQDEHEFAMLKAFDDAFESSTPAPPGESHHPYRLQKPGSPRGGAQG